MGFHPEQVASRGSAPRAKIMIIDDEYYAAQLFQLQLEQAGYEVVSFGCGIEAIEQLEDKRPDLVILDILLPQLNGYEVCRRLRLASSGFLPIIMVTAMRTEHARMLSIDAGADDLLRKPVAEEELLARVRNLLRVKQLQDSLLLANIELRRSQELRKELVEMVVHDLRNPLCGLLGYLDMVLGTMRDQISSRAARSLRAAKASSDLLNMLVDCMHELARLEESGNLHIKLEDIDVGAILPAIIESMGVEALGMKQEVLNRIEPGGIRIRGDKVYVWRILQNLLCNALRYTASALPRGRVEILAEEDVERGVTTIGVRDNGFGIAPEDLDRVFHKSYRVDAARQASRSGRGLGLTFCKMAVEAMSGRIWVESLPGESTSFFVALPSARQQVRQDQSPAGRSARPPLQVHLPVH
jgi:two-component system, sensor histidine kinase and response regulator